MGPLWARRMRKHGPCASRLGKERGILEWPKIWGADSRQAGESFASNRSQTQMCQKVCAHFEPGACAGTDPAHPDWGKNFAFKNGIYLLHTSPLSKLITCYGSDHYLYADDSYTLNSDREMRKLLKSGLRTVFLPCAVGWISTN